MGFPNKRTISTEINRQLNEAYDTVELVAQNLESLKALLDFVNSGENNLDVDAITKVNNNESAIATLNDVVNQINVSLPNLITAEVTKQINELDLTTNPVDPVVIPVTGMAIAGNLTLAANGTNQYTVTFNPTNATNVGNTVWSTNNSNVATVSQSGLLTWVSGGQNVSLTATNGAVSDTLIILATPENTTPVDNVPTVSVIPAVVFNENSTGATVNLSNYFSDDGTLAYSATQSNQSSNVTVSINSGIATITSAPDWFGTESIVFTATDVSNQTVSATLTVLVNEEVESTGDIVYSVTGNTVTLTRPSGATGEWDYGDGTTGMSDTKTYDIPDNYTVSINGLTDVIVVPVFVMPVAIITETHVNNVYTFTGVAGMTNVFSIGGNDYNGTPSYTHTFTSAGTEIVGLKVTDSVGNVDTTTASYNVQLPNVDPVITRINVAAAKLVVTYSAVTVDDESLFYDWTFTDSAGTVVDTSTSRTPEVTYLAEGDVTAVLEVTDGRGGSATSSVTTTIAATWTLSDTELVPNSTFDADTFATDWGSYKAVHTTSTDIFEDGTNVHGVIINGAEGSADAGGNYSITVPIVGGRSYLFSATTKISLSSQSTFLFNPPIYTKVFPSMIDVWEYDETVWVAPEGMTSTIIRIGVRTEESGSMSVANISLREIL